MANGVAMSSLRVRAYNVRFGDAILVSVPDRAVDGDEVLRHILIDVGNVLSGAGGTDTMFPGVVADVQRRLGGRPLDLYVMTHEHLDHVQGLPFAAEAGVELDVDYAWLPACAAPGYYETFTEARRQKEAVDSTYAKVRAAVAARGLGASPLVRSMLDNNDPASTASCVAYLRQLATERTSYVHRGFRLRAGVHHPFREARLSLWAPEQDTSAYFGRPTPFATKHGVRPRPPEGVDPKAFRELLRYLEAGLGDSMLFIDRAANNTSIVFTIEWRGWRLLFAGDAELASWSMMAEHGVLKPVHLLKVGHHGSHNGTPPDTVLDALLPPRSRRERWALVSTWPETYSGVPDELTMGRIGARVDHVVSTRDVATGEAVTIELEG
jgi:beta-lactamase superfamily II metal-dependent hydrolase